MSVIHEGGDVFDPFDTGSLRAVYLLALSALGHTHYVDQQVMEHLADAVFKAYVDAKFPRMPLSTDQVEDMAVLSIDLMLQNHPGSLISKH